MANKASLREAYGQELLELARKDQRIVALDADLSKSTMSCYLAEEFPDRFFEMGIAEQNMVSVAAGLALVGKIPFVNSFAVFAAGRPYDQIRQGIALPNLNVKIIGSSCGLSDYGDGATHQAVEDIAIMRSIPNMTVISPVDANETKKVFRAVLTCQGPVYIRLHRDELPVITDEAGEFTIGKIERLRTGKDIAIFANGIMVSMALAAAEKLAELGISVKVLNVPTIKPLDAEGVIKEVRDCRGVVTAEEHSIIGGLGSAISAALNKTPVPLERVGVNDSFGQSSESYQKLLAAYGLTIEAIVKASKGLLS